MSAYILCRTKKAKAPYFIENISTNIYTIEELCYYLFHNVYLVDQSIMNEELCKWLAEELGLDKLAYRLMLYMGKFAAEADVLYPIFKEINYLTYEEQKQLNEQLVTLEKEPLLIREKKKGDTLMRNGMYVQAIRVYQKLLEKEKLEECREGLTSTILNNLGCAYSYLFQMEKAGECFREAYEKSGNRDYLKSFLKAYRSVKTPIEYASVLAELAVKQDVISEVSVELEHFSRSPETEVYSQHVDEILEKMMADYHRSTGS